MKNKPTNDIYNPGSDIEAWIGILYACIASDGEVSKSEVDALAKMLSNKRKFENADIVSLSASVLKAFDEVGVKSLVDICSPYILEEDKPTLFAMAVEIVLADGLLELEERKIIEYIANTLKIDKALVVKIIEVMLIRNRGNLILD